MRKKVLFFLESLAGGGAEKVLTNIICNLDSDMFDITVCTVTDGDVYQEQVSQTCTYKSFFRVEDYRAGGIKKALFWMKIRLTYCLPPSLIYRALIRDKYDVEVAFVEGFSTKLIASSANRKSKKIAWVHTDLLHNAHADKVYRSLKEQEKTYQKYGKILCVSKNVKEAFYIKFPNLSHAYVQYNPVNETAILEQSREKIDPPYRQAGILLGTIGRLEEQKGYMRLLECVKRLVDEGYVFTLWILGKGSKYEQLSRYVQENHMEKAVQLIGFKVNPYPYLSSCDAFVCSSYAEGFSTAATESLILGKPIFTVDCAGMRELLADSECGEIVPNTDEALYMLLKKLVSGGVNLAAYQQAAALRGSGFRMVSRMKEIEQILQE